MTFPAYSSTQDSADMSRTEKCFSIEERMHEFRSGDEKTFSLVFNYFYPQLFHFALHYVKDRAEAEDQASEALYKLWERRENFKTSGNIKAFLFITLRNACLNLLKGQKNAARQFDKWKYLFSSEV